MPGLLLCLGKYCKYYCIDICIYVTDTLIMEIEDLYISKSIAEKLSRKHNVEVYEVYEAIWNKENAVLIVRSPRGSGTYIAFGRAESGRYLTIAFISKSKVAYILTARDMTKSERKLYKER